MVSFLLLLLSAGVVVVVQAGARFHGRDRDGSEKRTPTAIRPRALQDPKYTLTGSCAALPAERATEFHGNPNTSILNLGMAGNQWVVLDHFMQAFNEYRAEMGEADIDLTAIGNQPRTLEGLSKPGADYFIEAIPPGQIRDQIKSGCMILGNEDARNFLPVSFQVNFDVFTSTNFNLMRDLAANRFLTEAVPYIRNQLTLMTDADNGKGIGRGGGKRTQTVSAALSLLDPKIRVSEPDHINEGIHRGINAMYQRMDEYVRLNAAPGRVRRLDNLLRKVETPQEGSPAATREGISTEFDLNVNPACNYQGHPTIPDGTLRLCEFAILNKANTHETRVHHVETPERIAAGESDVGPVWISELVIAQDSGAAVSGYQPIDEVNLPVVYSVAFLATMAKDHEELAAKFVEFLLSPAGVKVYTDGGFLALEGSEVGERYSFDDEGNLVIEEFVP